MGPACQPLASTRFSSFGNTANPQIPCSRNLPAIPPQQNMVSGMLLVCNRIQQNVWLLMTNICPMTEHRVSFCSISDLFPQRKTDGFFPRNYPATTVSQIVSWLCPLAIYLPHATILFTVCLKLLVKAKGMVSMFFCHFWNFPISPNFVLVTCSGGAI